MRDHDIDHLDPNEGHDNSTHSVDPHIVSK